MLGKKEPGLGQLDEKKINASAVLELTGFFIETVKGRKI